MNKKALSTWQIRIFVLCWLAYACIYLGRLNLSISLPKIGEELSITKTQLGMIGSVFFWVYGIGQLINGYIGDKVSGRLIVFWGLAVAALSNILFGFTTSLVFMCVLWAINGYFQSMLWGPIAKIISAWFSRAKAGSAIIGISTSMIGGYMIVYFFGSKLLSLMDWRWAFRIPGLFILAYSAIWVWKIRNTPGEAGVTPPQEDAAPDSSSNEISGTRKSIWQISRLTGLWFIASACVAQGIVKDGITLWAPTYFLETFHLDIESAANLILIIPLMNFGGMLLAGWLNKLLGNNVAATTSVLFAAGTAMVLGLMLIGNKNIYASAIFLGLSSAMMYGANTMLLGVYPLSFSKYNLVSTAAGFLDFCSYLAAGFASLLTGFIADKFGWHYVITMWLVVTLIGVASLAVCHKFRKEPHSACEM